jgi:hypothetical protein
MMVVPGSAVEVVAEDGTMALAPKFEILPCCSHKYLKTVEGPTKLQKIKAVAMEALRGKNTRVKQKHVGPDGQAGSAADGGATQVHDGVSGALPGPAGDDPEASTVLEVSTVV